MSSAISLPPTDGLISRKPTEEGNDVKENDKKETRTVEFAHCYPIHTKYTSSILSRESKEGLSFRGFGNLACERAISSHALTEVLVMVFGNLRLIVENYVKVCCLISEVTVVRVSTSSSTFRSTSCRFQNKPGVVYSYTCPSIYFAMD